MRSAYLDRRLSLRDLAVEAGCGLRTVARWMVIHKIPTRTIVEGFALLDRSGPSNPRWKGGPPRCACGEVMAFTATTCGTCRDRTGASNPKWRGIAIGYAAAHDRVKSTRGLAGEHACASCQRPAQEWAYNGIDPDELSEGLLAYSADPGNYDPMCRSCHKRVDAGRRRAELAAHRSRGHRDDMDSAGRSGSSS